MDAIQKELLEGSTRFLPELIIFVPTDQVQDATVQNTLILLQKKTKTELISLSNRKQKTKVFIFRLSLVKPD